MKVIELRYTKHPSDLYTVGGKVIVSEKGDVYYLGPKLLKTFGLYWLIDFQGLYGFKIKRLKDGPKNN